MSGAKDEVYDVVILGAGLAGLGAARELRRNDRNVCILEAQQEPGGRVRTVNMNPTKSDEENTNAPLIVEAGAQWIHGKENSLFKIADENNLISPELGEEACGQFIRDDGKEFDSYLVKRVDFKIGQILENCEMFVESPLEKDASIREVLEEKFNEFLKENPEIDAEEGRQLLDWHIRFQIIDNSCWDLRDVGVNDWGRYSFNGESCQAHINVRNGFNEILDVIVKEVGDERILTNHEVTKIEWGKEISTIRSSNGKTFQGKFVIVTFPIGVLKRREGLFDPELPEDVRSSIDQMGYGTIDKIYLRFESPFWNADFKGIQFLWTETDEKIPKWIKSMTGFDLVSNNTLIGWIGGEGAVEMEQLTDQEIVEDCLRVIGQFLQKRIPRPSHYYCTRWNSNPFIRGSYCFNGPRDKNISRTSLNDPITAIGAANPSLFLAGEACHPSYFSTAHGAFESGREQALKIIKQLSS